MFSVRQICRTCRSFLRGLLGLTLVLLSQSVLAQTELEGSTLSKTVEVDPQLREIINIIKLRMESDLPTNHLRGPESLSRDKLYLNLVDDIQTATYSGVSSEITKAVEEFSEAYKADGSLDLNRIPTFYQEYADQLDNGAPVETLQELTALYSESGSWFEKYIALIQASFLYSKKQERQAALQKAQQALALIPKNSTADLYARSARSRVTATIAHLHNLQGNSELALIASLDYLRLTENDPDPKSEVDLINNLIYSYTISRNHEAQLFLTQELLDIEKNYTSSVRGLSEMRIAGVMNSVGRFEEGLDYANLALVKAENPTVVRVSQVAKGIALAGLGRPDRARAIANIANVNFDRNHMLNVETRQGDLYLAFLLAQAEDTSYATQLFNRQLDVTAQKFLADNSRDTTAMLADLENSRERQAEREKAAAREAQLQALTIDRQRKLNRLLTLLSFVLGVVAIGFFLFIKSREKLLKELEIKTVEAASAEKLKTEFLGMISHELRTPLNGIIGISDFLANYHEDPDIRKKTGIVLRSGNELLAVIESLTDMARLDAGQLSLSPHDADLSLSLSAVPEMWSEKAKEKDLVFTHFIDPAIGTHAVDEGRLIQCLNILMANAISFTDEGRVHMHITGKTDQQGNVVGLSAIVADTGQGMSELVQSRLFTPFMQADTSRKRTHMGTGLSLAIAYALADMMGGELSVISREGRGSEFKFDVPLDAATGELPKIMALADDGSVVEGQNNDLSETVETNLAGFESETVLDAPVLESVDAPKREFIDLMQPRAGFPSLHDLDELVLPTPAEGRQRILVVDDVDSNRDILRLILESQGHSCSEALDGLAALAMLDRQPFDLIVLDIHMTPMDGVETLRRLRNSEKAYADIPVIALTADNAASTNAACMDAGADLFLTKPVKQEELLRAISYLHTTESARILSQ